MRAHHALTIFSLIALTHIACDKAAQEAAPKEPQVTVQKEVIREVVNEEEPAADPAFAEPAAVVAPKDEAASADRFGGEGGKKVAESSGLLALRGSSSGEAMGVGGLGLSGTGRGGGGVASGSIGLGSVGGRGKGSSGYMGRALHMRPRPSMRPPIVPSQPDPVSNSEDYKDYGVNPWVETSKDKLSTFAADVDTGSYTIARRKLNEGASIPAASVRVEEFVNYFSYNYPNPDAGAFGVNLEAAPSPFVASKERYLLRVGVQGKRIAAKERKPVHLTFLVDVSGSMSQPDKLPMAKQALKILVNNLRGEDTVALATYAGHTATVLNPTNVSSKGRILEAIDSLGAGGGTGMTSGMEAAYKLALSAHKAGHVNRVIVLSDGDANIGPSSHEEILKRIKAYVDEGVTLSTIGLGMGNYKDTLMEQLANKGNGNYYYIDSLDEARKVFGEQADGTLQVIAKDVKLQVEFNPKAVKQYRLIGYENRDVRDQDFRNDKVDAGEIGAGHTVTAMYEIILESGHQEKDTAFVRVRHKEPEGYKASEQVFTLRPMELKSSLQDASKDFQFAAAVTGFAEILRQSPHAKTLSFSLIEEVAKTASSPNQKDRQEFIALVQKAKASQKAQ